MKTTYLCRMMAIGSAVTIGAASAARATPVGTLNVTLDGYRGGTFDTSIEDGGAGAFRWKNVSGSAAGMPTYAPDGTFLSFCIELRENISLGSTYSYSVVPPAEAPELNGGAGPMGTARAGLLGSWFTSYYMGHTWSDWGATTNDQKLNTMAFQLGIWEIIYETDTLDPLNPTNSSFRVDNYPYNINGNFYVKNQEDAAELADDWLDNGTWWTLAPTTLGAMSSPVWGGNSYEGPNLQDQVFAMAPAPAAAGPIAALAALLGLAALRRRGWSVGRRT